MSLFNEKIFKKSCIFFIFYPQKGKIKQKNAYKKKKSQNLDIFGLIYLVGKLENIYMKN